MLLLALILAQTPQHRLFLQPNLPRGSAAAFDVTGFGVSGPCVTTAPTTEGGLTLTATRTGNATCSKQGPATTGILAGDLVVMTTDQPRLSLVGSLLMYLRESAGTNTCLRSDAINNAAWIDSMTVVAGPTLNGANTIVAPDGATTAEDYSFPAVSAGAYSFRAQLAACPLGVPVTGSFFAMSISGGTTLDLNLQTGAASWTAGPCTIATGSYARCTFSATTGASNSTMYIGVGQVGGSVTRSATRIAIWGAQCNAGVWASSYNPTAGATSTRNADSAMSATLVAALGPSFSLGVSAQWLDSSITTGTALQLGTAATDLARVGRNTNTAASLLINATTTTPAVSAMGTTTHRGSLNDASGTRTAWWDSVSIAAPADSMVAGTTAISFGAVDSYTGRACADGVSGRCD